MDEDAFPSCVIIPYGVSRPIPGGTLLASERRCRTSVLFGEGSLPRLAADSLAGFQVYREDGSMVVVVASEGREFEVDGGGRASGLRGCFFGGFAVYSGGEIVDLGQNNKAIAILKCLLARKGRPISQDLLMGWLWPESNVKKARWSLNSTVYSLRRTLEGSSSALSRESVLLEKGHYRLSPGVPVSSDVEEFDARFLTGRSLERAGRKPEAVSEYEKAVGLYRGDYLVEDLYEDWTTIERERLINDYVDILTRLATHYARAGHYRKAIDSRYKLLDKDPYHEESYRALMHCYDHLGLRGRALQQYRLCERALGSLYGTSPAPETKALYKELLGSKEG